MPLDLNPNPSTNQADFRAIADAQRQVIRARRIVTPGLALRAATLASAYPNIDSGQVVGLALGQQQPGSPTAETVAERQLLQTATTAQNGGEGFFDNFVYDPFKGLIRGVFTALNAGIEEAESLFVRAPIGAFQGVDDAVAMAGRSDASYALAAALRGERVNLGEGFFPNSQVADDVQQKLAEGMTLADAMAGSIEQEKMGTPITQQGQMDRERLKITSRAGNSTPISFGRALAINVTEPGTRSFQYLSGFADITKQVVLDPADLLLGGAGKVRKLSKLVGAADDANMLSRAARSVLLGGSPRKTFFSSGWDEYLASPQGAFFIDKIAKAEGDQGFRDIYDLYRGSQNAVDPSDINKLVAETDFVKTGELVRNLAGDAGGDFKKFGKVGFGSMASGTVGDSLRVGRGPVQDASLMRKAISPAGIRSLPSQVGVGAFVGTESLAQGIGAAFGLNPIKGASRVREALDIPMRSMMRDAYETGLGFSVRQASNDTWLGKMAASTSAKAINVNDRVQALDSMNEYLRSLGMPDEDYNRLIRKTADPDGVWAKALDDGEDGFTLSTHYFRVLKEANGIWAQKIRDMGGNVSEEALTSMERMYDSFDDMRAFWLNNVGEDVFFSGARVTFTSNGEAVAQPTPILFSQFMEQNIPLMDMGKVRSIQRKAWWADKAKGDRIKAIFGVVDSEKVGQGAFTSAADFTMGKLWKPSVLLRVAWPVRVIGEEQFRLSGALLSGAVNHPLQFMAIMMTKDNRVLGKLSRLDNDALGRAFMDSAQYDSAMSKSLKNMRGGRKSQRWQGTSKADLGQRGSAEAFVYNFNQMYENELSRVIARRISDALDAGETPDASTLRSIKDAFWDGKYEHLRRRLADDSGSFNIMDQRRQADAYIDSLFAQGVHSFGGKGDLLSEADNAWRNFDGDVVDARDVGRGAGVGSQAPAPTGAVSSPEFDRITDDVVEAMNRGEPQDAIATGATDQIVGMDVTDIDDPATQQLVTAFEDSLAEAQTVEEARIAIESIRDQLSPQASTLAADGSVAQTGARELIPGQEIEFQGDMRMGDSRRINQTMGEQKLETQVPNYLNNAKGDIVLSGESTVEELKNIGPEDYRTFTMGGGAMDISGQRMTYTFGEGGRPVAFLSWTQREGKIYVDFMGGIDNRGVERLMRDLADQGDIAPNDIINAVVGGERMIDYLRRAAERTNYPMPDNVKTYPQLLKWMKENPDSLKAIGAGDVMPPSSGLAQMTASGQGMLRRAVLPEKGGREAGVIRQATEGAPQHTEYFKMQELGDVRGWKLLADGELDGFKWGDNLSPQQMKQSFKERADFFDSPEWYDAMPEYLRNPVKEAGSEQTGIWDTAISTMMELLMTKPTNKLSRSPAFQQIYWQRMSKMYNQADDDIRDLIRLQAQNAGMTSGGVRVAEDFARRIDDAQSKIDDIARQIADEGFEELDEVARRELKIRLTETKKQLKALEADKPSAVFRAKVATVGKPVRALRRASGREVAVDEVIRRFDADRVAGADIIFEAGDNADVAIREMDEIAKAYALEEVKTLLYDMANEHNWSEMFRNVTPFGEAWYEVFSTWGKLMVENPRNMRRMQQAYQGAQGSDPFRGTGPDGEQGRGMFYRDPRTGEEIFSYPGVGLIPDWMPIIGAAASADENLELTGRVQGVSMMAQVMPGIGPVIQIPLSMLPWASDPNNADSFLKNEILLPFGKSRIDFKDPQTVLSPFLPSWFNKGIAAVFGEDVGGENKRLFMNTQMDVYKSLIMKGWSDSTEEDMKRTLEEAARITKSVYAIKTLASFAGPTGATELWEVKYDDQDTQGEAWAFQNLATAYRQILDQVNGDDIQAYKKFTDIFGEDPTLFTTAKTQRVRPRAVTMEARRWEYDNKGLYDIDKYPNTAYYARPDGVDGEFDYDAYLMSLKEGTRQPLTTEQWALRRNQMLGKIGYANFQRTADRRFTDTNTKQQWLRQQQASLMAYFPGYGRTIPGLPATADLNTQIQELYRWEQEPALNESKVGESLSVYLDMRNRIIQRTMSIYGYKTDTGFRTGKNAVLYRQQLRKLGEKLSAENPDFVPIFTQILLRELQEPEAGQQPVQLAGTSF